MSIYYLVTLCALSLLASSSSAQSTQCQEVLLAEVTKLTSSNPKCVTVFTDSECDATLQATCKPAVLKVIKPYVSCECKAQASTSTSTGRKLFQSSSLSSCQQKFFREIGTELGPTLPECRSPGGLSSSSPASSTPSLLESGKGPSGSALTPLKSGSPIGTSTSLRTPSASSYEPSKQCQKTYTSFLASLKSPNCLKEVTSIANGKCPAALDVQQCVKVSGKPFQVYALCEACVAKLEAAQAEEKFSSASFMKQAEKQFNGCASLSDEYLALIETELGTLDCKLSASAGTLSGGSLSESPVSEDSPTSSESPTTTLVSSSESPLTSKSSSPLSSSSSSTESASTQGSSSTSTSTRSSAGKSAIVSWASVVVVPALSALLVLV